MADEELSDVLKTLSDEHSRKILQETMKRPMSANELSDICDISPQSVYRRTDELTSHGLLQMEMEYDEDGHTFGLLAPIRLGSWSAFPSSILT